METNMAEDIIHFSLQKPPEFLFYATDEYSIDKVMRNGLNRPKMPITMMYESAEEAKRKIPRDHISFLVIILSNVMAEDGYFFSHAETGEWFANEIPPKYIRLQ